MSARQSIGKISLCRIADYLVLQFVLELNASCLDVVREDVVEALPLFCKVKTSKSFEPAYLMEPNDASLIKCDQQFASGARLCELDCPELRVSKLYKLRAEHVV